MPSICRPAGLQGAKVPSISALKVLQWLFSISGPRRAQDKRNTEQNRIHERSNNPELEPKHIQQHSAPIIAEATAADSSSDTRIE